MMDYMELIRSLRNCSNNRCAPCDCGWFNKYQVDESCKEIIMWKAAAAIEALQAQFPKRGEWVEENRRPRSSQFVCSECHRTAYDPQPTRDKAWKKRCRYAYCPNCGAKMDGEVEHE